MKRPRKYATTSEAQLRAEVALGLSWVEIAEKLNLPILGLRQTASILGIAAASRSPQTAAKHAAWVNRLEAGATLQEIADDYGVTRQNVHWQLHNRNLPTSCRAAVKFKAARAANQAPVAQSEEQRTRNASVAGSMPARGPIAGA